MNLRPQPMFAFATLLLGLMVVASGCQTTGKSLSAVNPLTAFGEEETPTGTPERIVGTWTEAVLHQAGKGTRGFGGRLFFYDRKSDEPIRVEGQLVVYAFDEEGRHATDNKPTKRYVFPPEQFAKHESHTDLGVSYSLWLPWDAVGGPQSEVSLIARFEPLQGGGLVVSDQARQRLPGSKRPEAMLAEEQSTMPVKQTSFNASVQANEVQPAVAQPQMKATTISLPGHFQNRTLAPTVQTTPQDQPAAVTLPTSAVLTTGAASPANAAVPAGKSSSQALSGTPSEFQATPIGTSVKYLTPGETVRRSVQPRSFGSSP